MNASSAFVIVPQFQSNSNDYIAPVLITFPSAVLRRRIIEKRMMMVLDKKPLRWYEGARCRGEIGK